MVAQHDKLTGLPSPGRREVLAGLAAVTAVGAAPQAVAASFPGWAKVAPARSGRLLRVSSLAGEGPGSLRAAIEAEGPRTVVFDVAGIIDLGRKSLQVKNPHLTIDGASAPSPGITLIRGGVSITTDDVVIRHIRVRPGQDGAAKGSGWEVDGLSCRAAHDVWIDQCSFSWATDEGLSASGPRFNGSNVQAWREGTSRRITFSNNIVAEGLSDSSHAKGEHSKGSLIHDNVTQALIVGNLYAHNLERNPLFKGGVSAVCVNNLIYDPGKKAIHYALFPKEWGTHPAEVGRLALVGNVVRGGPSTALDVPFLMLEGAGDLDLFASGNLATRLDGSAMPLVGFRPVGRTPSVRSLARAPLWPQGLQPLPSHRVEAQVLAAAGARPWDRDVVDQRIVRQVRERTGRIIDNEDDVGGRQVVKGR
jgi:pectate lyase